MFVWSWPWILMYGIFQHLAYSVSYLFVLIRTLMWLEKSEFVKIKNADKLIFLYPFDVTGEYGKIILKMQHEHRNLVVHAISVRWNNADVKIYTIHIGL